MGAGGRGSGPREDGWALLIILFFSALLVISLSRVLPRAAFETRRDREADLIFRGRQYSRAIQLYFRKFRKYPANLEDLENTNQIRFLRKRFRDPIANSDEWRLLHIGPAGVIVDSLLQKPTAVPGAPGTAAPTAGQTGITLPGPVPAPGVPTSGFIPQLGQQQAGQPPPVAPGFPPTGALGASVGATVGGFVPTPGAPGPQLGGIQQFGAAIAGVASKREAQSIKLFNGRQKYNEWEFVYDFRRDPLMMAPQQGAVPGAPGQPGPQQPLVPGQPPGLPGFPGVPGMPEQPPRRPQFPPAPPPRP